jgi:integrase
MQTVSRRQDDSHRTQAFQPGRRRPRGLHAEVDFRGNPIWTYREGHGKRVRFPDELTFGTQAFEEFYYKTRLTYGHADAAPVAVKPVGLSPSNPASLAWLIDQFLRSPGQRRMAEGTQKQRRNVLGRIALKNGSAPFRDITEETIRGLRDKIVATGKLTAASAAIAHLRLVFDWAIEQKHVTRNPCLGVKGVEYKGGTNHVWTDDEAARFEEAYPLGTMEHQAYALLLYSGQRGVDAVKIGRQHVRDGKLSGLKAQKTGKPIMVPVHPLLQEVLDAGPTGDLAFLIDPKTGAPFKIERFGKWFRAACDKAGVSECTPHGLRHLGATRLAANGASYQTLQAIYGWNMQTAMRYTQTAEHYASAEAEIHLLSKTRAERRTGPAERVKQVADKYISRTSVAAA